MEWEGRGGKVVKNIMFRKGRRDLALSEKEEEEGDGRGWMDMVNKPKSDHLPERLTKTTGDKVCQTKCPFHLPPPPFNP